MKKKREQGSVVNIGTTSMIVIFIGLCFSVLAALAISSASNDYKVAQALADHVSSYYAASNEATELLADSDQLAALYATADEDGTASFTVTISDSQVLNVSLTFDGSATDYIITQWQVQNVTTWIADDTLPVLTGSN